MSINGTGFATLLTTKNNETIAIPKPIEVPWNGNIFYILAQETLSNRGKTWNRYHHHDLFSLCKAFLLYLEIEQV